MIKIIKNGIVYTPRHLGHKDVAILGSTIAAVGEDIRMSSNALHVQIIDARGKLLVPGFIDSHVHIIGGGGEGGFSTRTPEIQLTSITTAGVTTVVGCLGTDGTTRHPANLLAKARALDEEGITAYIYTGSYEIPVRSITGRCRDDIILIDKVIGIGEIAISDHRSSQPSVEEIAKIAAEARVGGMLSGKSGVVNIHVGDGPEKLDCLLQIANNTEIPITQFIPTHLNRSIHLLEASKEFACMGGYVDLSTSGDTDIVCDGEIRASTALRKLIERGAPIDNITFSSDGQGSLPVFDSSGNLTGLKVGEVRSLFREFRAAVMEEGIPLEDALKVVTSNVAKALKLYNKGDIAPGKDADIVMLDRGDLSIDTVICKGKVMVQGGRPVVKGTFE